MFTRKLISVTMVSLVLAMLVTLATWIIPVTHATWMSIDTLGWQRQVSRPQQPDEPLTPEQRARLSEQALAHLRRFSTLRNHRLRVHSIKRLLPEKEADQRPIASVVVFNYSQGRATRLIMDISNGTVLREEPLRGRPQASDEERQEARQIIRADPEHARLLEAGGILEGGFIVNAPGRESSRDRFIQFQILTSNRQGLQRFVTVNLTTGRIAESKQQ